MKGVYLSLGTNLGDRRTFIQEALDRLDAAIGRHYSAISEIIETEAVGFSGPSFLNCVVRYDTDCGPFALLDICKGIERSMGRTDAPEYDSSGKRVYHDRVIDIDILRFGNLVMDTQILTIPHKGLKDRAFFIDLMAQIS